MLEILAEELKKPDYNNLSEQEIINIINNKTIILRELVPTWKVKQHAIENGYYAAIRIASEDINNPSRGLCISVLAWIDDSAGKITNLDMDSSVTVSMINGLLQANLISESQKTTLLDLANTAMKWVDYVGIGEVGIGYIRSGRLMNG